MLEQAILAIELATNEIVPAVAGLIGAAFSDQKIDEISQTVATKMKGKVVGREGG
jgi:hypothetical protein